MNPMYVYVYTFDAPWRKKMHYADRKDVGYSAATKGIVHGIYRRLRRAGFKPFEARYMVTALLSHGMACGSHEHHDMVLRAFRNAEQRQVTA